MGSSEMRKRARPRDFARGNFLTKLWKFLPKQRVIYMEKGYNLTPLIPALQTDYASRDYRITRNPKKILHLYQIILGQIPIGKELPVALNICH